MKMKNYALHIILCICLSVGSSLSYAEMVSVNKIRVNLSAKQAIDTLRLTNPNANDTTNVQLRVVKWTQKNGEDVYQNTNELVVAPPVVRIGPNRTQLVRLGLRAANSSTDELAYRIFIREIKPRSQNTQSSNTSQISFDLIISLPIFVEPSSPRDLQLNWSAKRINDKTLQLQLSNKSNVHVQVKRLVLIPINDDKPITEKDLSYYLLPNTTSKWKINTPTSLPAKLRLQAETDQGNFTELLNVS